MKDIRNVFFFLTITILVSCGDDIDSSTFYQKPINIVDSTTKYTLSKPYNIDFHVCGSQYAILYKYGKSIDSVLMHSGVFFIGSDSALYVQVRSGDDLFPNEPTNPKSNDITGTVTNLIIYNGTHFNTIKPPLFNVAFSAFYYQNYYMYYWGHEYDDTSNHTFACRYHIQTKEFSKVFLTDEIAGTDYIGAFEAPKNKDGNIEFHCTNSPEGRWEVKMDWSGLKKEEMVDSLNKI